MPPLLKGLAEQGFVVGRNVAIEYRWANDYPERLPELAADLVRRQTSLIVAGGGTFTARAVRAASLTIPIAITCALFAEEIVSIVLGPKWMAAAPIFRLLAPVAVVFTVGNPLSWLVMSTGRMGRALAVRTATIPLLIPGVVL